MSDLIKDIAFKINWENKDEVIDFYESNQLYFSNYNSISDIDSIIDLIHFKQRYIEALESKQRYYKALPILTDIDILLQKIKKEDIYKTVYERYLFLSGLLYGRLKRFQESQDYFVELCAIDSENDLYKEWFESNKVRIIAKQTNIIGWLGFGIAMLDLFWEVVFEKSLGRYVGLIGFSIMIVGFSIPFVLKQVRKIRG